MSPIAIEELLRDQLLGWFEDNPPCNGTTSISNGNIAFSTAKNGRDDNQDRAFYARFHSTRTERCFALAAVLDGIGGLIDGGRCAELAVVSILANLVRLPRQKNRISLVEALTLANLEVHRTYKGRGGATFAGVFFEGTRLRCVNIGDSRVYQHDPSRGGLIRLSSDDRLGDQIAKLKGLENVALNPELAARLGQYLGMGDQIRPNVRVVEKAAFHSPVGFFLLSTDGAYAAGDDFIANTFSHCFDAPKIADVLIKRTSQTTDADNATVLCAKANAISIPNKITRSDFEHLQLWTLNGAFSFVFPSIFSQYARSQRSKGRTRKGPVVKTPPSGKSHVGDSPTHSQPPDKNKDSNDAPKRQVIIQQLKFESEGESAE